MRTRLLLLLQPILTRWVRKKSNEARAKKNGAKKRQKKVSKGRTYTFYHHGNTMKLVIYDEYFTVTNMNGKTIWYHAEKAAIAKMKDIFKEAYQKQKQNRLPKRKQKFLEVRLLIRPTALLNQMLQALIVMRWRVKEQRNRTYKPQKYCFIEKNWENCESSIKNSVEN